MPGIISPSGTYSRDAPAGAGKREFESLGHAAERLEFEGVFRQAGVARVPRSPGRPNGHCACPGPAARRRRISRGSGGSIPRRCARSRRRSHVFQARPGRANSASGHGEFRNPSSAFDQADGDQAGVSAGPLRRDRARPPRHFADTPGARPAGKSYFSQQRLNRRIVSSWRRVLLHVEVDEDVIFTGEREQRGDIFFQAIRASPRHQRGKRGHQGPKF